VEHAVKIVITRRKNEKKRGKGGKENCEMYKEKTG
jgi:hypothetical protein